MENEHDCCKNKDDRDCCCSRNKDKIGMKNILLFGMAAVVIVISLVQSFQINSLKSQITANVVSAASSNGGVDMSGWTENEKMMYEHHGNLPARLGNSNQQSGMVGGC